MSLALGDVVPHTIVQLLHLRVGELESHLAKRLLQQYRSKSDDLKARKCDFRCTPRTGHDRAGDVGFVPEAEVIYSITWSASNWSELGTVRPSAVAVFRLMTSSYLSGS